MKRREFLKVAGAASAATMAHGAMAQSGRGCSIIIDGNDPVAGAPPVRWAAEQLRGALAAKGALCRILTSGERIRGAAFYVLVNSAGPASTGPTAPSNAPHLPAWRPGEESFALTPGKFAGMPATFVSGSDVRGYVYGLLEMAERVRFAADARTALCSEFWSGRQAVGAIFAVTGQSVALGQDFWLGYLDLLAACRFNRFSLAFGLEYDFPRGVTSDYLHFPYPYLVNVPGYERARDATGCCRTELCCPRRFSSAPRTADEPGGAAIHCRADGGARAALPAGDLDACVRVDRQPACVSPHRRADEGDARGLLPRRAGDAAEAMPGDSGADHARARRERDSGGQLRILARRCSRRFKAAGARSRSTCTPRAWTKR
jgi:hypothetical protein